MKSVGILFPTSAQVIGMGHMRDTYPAASKLFDQASEILGYDLAVSEQGPESRLNETVYSQPACSSLEWPQLP